MFTAEYVAKLENELATFRNGHVAKAKIFDIQLISFSRINDVEVEIGSNGIVQFTGKLNIIVQKINQ